MTRSPGSGAMNDLPEWEWQMEISGGQRSTVGGSSPEADWAAP
jgi:hypothetical protein